MGLVAVMTDEHRSPPRATALALIVLCVAVAAGATAFSFNATTLAFVPVSLVGGAFVGALCFAVWKRRGVSSNRVTPLVSILIFIAIAILVSVVPISTRTSVLIIWAAVAALGSLIVSAIRARTDVD
jgi:peptidoglycan/LPS O-acetylase OafA/YrhL